MLNKRNGKNKHKTWMNEQYNDTTHSNSFHFEYMNTQKKNTGRIKPATIAEEYHLMSSVPNAESF